MALKKKKKKKKKESEKEWRSIGTIWESDRFDGEYITINEDVELYYKDSKTDEFFKVKQMSLFEPSEKAPEAVVQNLAINLRNEYQIEVVEEE